nr:retrovirus-related Pol polyprotein from transposon TNT 1-94 [Tanacetum cinerariifolium]
MVSSVKLPIFKKGEEQYLAHTAYAIWEVILNGNSAVQMSKDEAGNEIKVPPVTAQQILARTRERKAKITLLLSIPDEHLARFYRIKDAKTLWAAVKAKFCEGLEKGYDRFQRLFSLLEIHEAGVFTKDANQKFLRSLPSAWINISLIMRNKPGIDTLDIDDLYNNLKVYEANIKGSFGSSSNSQNVAFVFVESTSSTNELNAAYSVSTATLDKEDLEQIDQDDLEEIRDYRSARHLGNRSSDVGNAGYRGKDNGERPAKKEEARALVVQDGLGTYDWCYQVDEEAIDFALMAFTLNPSSSSSSNLSQTSVKVKTGLGYDSQFNEKEVLDIKEDEVTETVFDNLSSDEENNGANDRFKKGKAYHAVPPPLIGNYMPLKPNLSFTRLDDFIYKFKISEIVTSLAKDEKDTLETSTAFVVKPKEDRSSSPLIEDWVTDSNDDSVFTPAPILTKIDFVKASESIKHVKPVESIKYVKPVTPVKTAEQTETSKNFIFTRSGRIPVSAAKPKAAASTSAAKPVNIVRPKQSVNFSRTRSTFHKSHSSIRRSFYKATTHSRRNLTNRVNTAGLKAVSVVKGNRVTAIQTLTVTDDFSRFSWVFFLATKDETSKVLKPFITDIENQINKNVKVIRCDNGIEFKNRDLNEFFGMKGIKREYSNAITLQALVTKTQNKTPYELLNGRTPRLDFMRPFGCPVMILNTLDPLGKFEGKADEGFLVRYSVTSKAFRFLHGIKLTKNAGLQNTNGNAGTQDNVDAGKEVSDQHYIVLPLWSSISSTYKNSDDKYANDTPKDDIEEPINKDDKAYRDELNRLIINAASTSRTFNAGGSSSPHLDAFIPANTLLHVDQDDSQIPDWEDTTVAAEADFNNMESSTIVNPIPIHKMEPKKVSQALDDESWVKAMQEELLQFSLQKVFALVTRIEAIKIFLAFASFMGFIVYQMVVKSTFLYVTIEEEVYVSQPLSFIDPQFPNKVYKVEKALYGLHQAPRDWYETLSTFLLQNGYRRGTIDNTLFIKKYKDDIMLVQVYVDDIIFGSTKKSLGDEFEALMHKRFQMSSLGELTFFLGLQCKKQTILATSTTEAEYVVTAHYCRQFWNTAIFKTVNSVKQIHVIVDGKAVVISESSMRSDLIFNDEDEKKQRVRNLGMKLFTIGTSKKKTLDKENVSKHGRDESNKTEELNLSDKRSGETEVFDYTTTAKKDVNAVEPVFTASDVVNVASVIPDVSAAGPFASAAGPSTSIAKDIFEDKMTTIADTLMAIRRTRPRTTSVVIHDVEEEPRRATPPPTVQIQDKVNGKMVEPEPIYKNPIKS